MTLSHFVTTVWLLLIAHLCVAQDAVQPEPAFQQFDGVTVHYSVFSSTSLLPAMAQQYGLVRGKDYVLLNIALVEDNNPGSGIPATVSGTATNLMQQQKQLAFQTIAEKTATYYIAPLRVTNEEIFHFEISVDPEGKRGPYTVKFTKKLYVNE